MGDFGAKLVRLVIWFAIVAVALISLARFFLVDIAVVGHNAMAPGLHEGDEILVFRYASLGPGDIAVCPHPRDPSDFVIGRVVALPGGELRTEQGQLVSSGSRAVVAPQNGFSFYDTLRDRTDNMRRAIESFHGRSYAIMTPEGQSFELEAHKVTGGLYLLSDNRFHPSQDSRSFGEVPAASCLGRAFMRLTPSDRTPPELDHGYFDWLD